LKTLAVVLAALLVSGGKPRREDGYELWLRYVQVADAARLAEYRVAITQLVLTSDAPTMQIARDELTRGLTGLLGRPVPIANATAHSSWERRRILSSSTPSH
jgi:alpha-glucuronidase